MQQVCSLYSFCIVVMPQSQWAQLNSPRFGLFWFNKFTGETRQDFGQAAPDEREQEIALFNEAFAKIDTLTLELEQEQQKGKELENQLAIANEELETLASQLDDTGIQLDEANAEVRNLFCFLLRYTDQSNSYTQAAGKEAEISRLNTIITQKDKTIVDLHAQG